MGKARLALALAAAPIWAACGATLVETRRRVSGPVAEVGVLDPGGGEARYSLGGPGLAVRSRRRDAFAKMGAACGGPERFKVVDEVAREEAVASFRSEGVGETVEEGGKHFELQMVQHLYFECLK